MLDLDKSLPSTAQMEDSFMAVVGLHCVESAEKLAELDLSLLEANGRQALVAAILKLASEVAEGVSMGQVVVLQEGEARTTSILVASVAQILLEEEFWTRAGLETLIQNNWVSLEFPSLADTPCRGTPTSTAAPCSSPSCTASTSSGSSSPPA